ncbi:MAG: hypothetical protein JNK87_17885 [Bryobacterales bacterium]|nr:hypothetical protein [Bryobacterales bacterium]
MDQHHQEQEPPVEALESVSGGTNDYRDKIEEIRAKQSAPPAGGGTAATLTGPKPS